MTVGELVVKALEPIGDHLQPQWALLFRPYERHIRDNIEPLL